MSAERETPELPPDLRRYFQEYDAERLTWDEGRETIISRLLECGGWDAVRWLRAWVGDEGIREVLVRRRGRGLTPKRLRFWGLVLDLPPGQVDQWVAARRSDPWHLRTRR